MFIFHYVQILKLTWIHLSPKKKYCLFRLTRPYLKFSAYNPSYFISFSQQTQSWNICMPSPRYIQCKKKISWSPLPNLFHRVTGNPKHTIICLGLVCMYLLSCMYKKYFWSTRCLKKKLDSLLTDIKNPMPPPSFTNKIVGV